MLLKIGDRTTQIDHILVNRAGVFVIETKNFSGVITGAKDDDSWKHIAKHGYENMFYNPIRQNETHVKLVKEILGNKSPIFSLVVFVNNNKPLFSPDTVVNMSEFRNKVIEKSLEINLSSEEIQNVAAIIKDHISHSEIDRQKHLEMAKQTKELLEESRCPRCKRKLILKKGRFGEFWACSGFPDCNYTKDK